MKQSKFTLCLAFVLLACLHNQSFGSIIAKYNVFSTSKINGKDNLGNDAPHGLWLSSDDLGTNGFGKQGSNYYDIQAGTTLTQFSDGTATLMGTAINPYGDVATIDLILSGFEDTLSNPGTQYKKESGAAYNGATQDFYSMIDGTITISGIAVTIDQMVGPHRFQLGAGANAKVASEFGASAWIQESPEVYQLAHHWDFNLTLESVPEPTAVVVWSLLVVGVSGAVRMRSEVGN